MLDRSLRLTFRDFSTYFLIVATVLLPLELVYGAVFSDVIAVRELHPGIERLPEGSAILGVTADRLDIARWSRWGLSLIQVALLPWLALGTRRALEASDRGETPTVVRALSLVGRGGARGRVEGAKGHTGLLLTVATISLAIGLLTRYLGELLTQPFQGSGSWALMSVVETVARSAGAPFLLVAWAQLSRSREGDESSTPNLF